MLEELAAEVRAGQADEPAREPRPASGDFSPVSKFKSRLREISPVQVPLGHCRTSLACDYYFPA